MITQNLSALIVISSYLSYLILFNVRHWISLGHVTFHQKVGSKEKVPPAKRLASPHACALVSLFMRWKIGDHKVGMWVPIDNLCMMTSSVFIFLVMKNMFDVSQTPCMTLDKENNFCLSGAMISGAGSKCDLYFLYLLCCLYYNIQYWYYL